MVTWLDVALDGPASLVCPSMAQLQVLGALAAAPEAVLAVGQEHFVTWLAGRTASEIAASVKAEHGLCTAELDSPWKISLLLLCGEDPVGIQRIVSGERWPQRRTVYTSGWVLRSHQGIGIGGAARKAVLDFAFTSCGAEAARTHVLVDNLPSRRISERLGYRVIREKAFVEDGYELVEIVYELRPG